MNNFLLPGGIFRHGQQLFSRRGHHDKLCLDDPVAYCSRSRMWSNGQGNGSLKCEPGMVPVPHRFSPSVLVCDAEQKARVGRGGMYLRVEPTNGPDRTIAGG